MTDPVILLIAAGLFAIIGPILLIVFVLIPDIMHRRSHKPDEVTSGDKKKATIETPCNG